MSSGPDTVLNHLRDVGLHCLGALGMMVPCVLASTPWWVAPAWAPFVSGFWFLREWAQSRDDASGPKPIREWGHWKHIEWIAPAVVALGGAVGIVVWRS